MLQRGDSSLTMFGLVNAIPEHFANTDRKQTITCGHLTTPELASIELYHRKQHNPGLVDGKYICNATVSDGFDVEV